MPLKKNRLEVRAIVRLFYKVGDLSTISNYFPISQTYTLCKIIEFISKDNLLNLALSYNIITAKHGFLPKRSTYSQMLYCTVTGEMHWIVETQ